MRKPARRILIYDRPFFQIEGTDLAGDGREIPAVVGRHGFDAILTSEACGIDLFIGSARTTTQQALAQRDSVRLRTQARLFEAMFVDSPKDQYHQFKGVWSDSILWLIAHGCIDEAPTDSMSIADFLSSYEIVNRRMAERAFKAVMASPGPVEVHWHDYHLWGAPSHLRALLTAAGPNRPDVRMSHFNHIPFFNADHLKLLPESVSSRLLSGMLGNDVIRFQTQTDADKFRDACERILKAEACSSRRVKFQDRSVRLSVRPFPVDRGRLRRLETDPQVRDARRAVRASANGRPICFMTGRIDPTKDIVGAFLAFRRYLTMANPSDSAVLIAQLQLSRTDLPIWQRYREKVNVLVRQINDEFGRPNYRPIQLTEADDMIRAAACYMEYDVLDVVPAADGLNLVSMEGPLINRVDGMLVLSKTAGSSAYLGDGAILVSPRNTDEHANALIDALAMSRTERSTLAKRLRTMIPDESASSWIDAQSRELWDGSTPT